MLNFRRNLKTNFWLKFVFLWFQRTASNISRTFWIRHYVILFVVDMTVVHVFRFQIIASKILPLFVGKSLSFSLRSKTYPYGQRIFPLVPLLLWFFCFGLVCSDLLKMLFRVTKFDQFHKFFFWSFQVAFDGFRFLSQLNIN